MHPDRLLPAHRFVERDVARRAGQPFLAADHVRDLHLVVVGHRGEVVGREAVPLQQHVVVEQLVAELDRAAQLVFNNGRALARHCETDDVRLAVAHPGLAAATVVAGRALLALLRLPHLVQPLGRADAAVGAAFREQPLDDFAVDR